MSMREYTHDDAQAALAAAALGALEGDELAAVRAHARGCAGCAEELAAYEEVAGRLAFAVPAAAGGAVPDASRSARTRARLLARAAADRGSEANPAGDARDARAVAPPLIVQAGGATSAPRAPVAAAPRARWSFALAASLLIAVASLAALAAARRDGGALRERLAAVNERATAAERQVAALRDSVAARDQAMAAVTGRDVVVVELTASGTRAPAARMFWDRASDRWTLVAHDLPQPAPGRTYQLWLVTRAGERVSAGTFAPDAQGSAQVRATYALPREALQVIAITEEPAGGVPQPTGPIVIAGSPAS